MLRLRGLSLRGELAASFPPNLAYAVICFREFPEVRLYPPPPTPPKDTPAARPPRINMRQVPQPPTPPYPSLPLPTPPYPSPPLPTPPHPSLPLHTPPHPSLPLPTPPHPSLPLPTPPYPSQPLPTPPHPSLPLPTQVRFEVDADVSMGTVPFADPDPSPISSPSPGPTLIPTIPLPDGSVRTPCVLRAYSS